MTYTVVVRAEPEGGYTALIPALPDVSGYGPTAEEARAAAASALRQRLAGRKEAGAPLPPDVEVGVLEPEEVDEEEYERLVDEGIGIVMAERMADPENQEGIPWDQVKADLGL